MHFRRIKGPSLARITPGTILKRAWQQLKKEVPPNRPKSDDSVFVKGPLAVIPPLIPPMIYRPELTTAAGVPDGRASGLTIKKSGNCRLQKVFTNDHQQSKHRGVNDS
jgi:hypothetical protein